MRVLLPLLLGLALLALLLRHFLKTPPRDLVRQLYLVGGVGLFLVAAVLLVLRAFVFVVPLAGAGLFLLRHYRALRWAQAPEQTSSVRSAGLDMRLDHATGEVDGHIRAGRHKGRWLSELDPAALREVAADLGLYPESLRLLEGYLDRAHPGWRGERHADAGEGERPAPGARGMSEKEAYQVLGLQPGASDAEVRDAHRRLIKQVHPDAGGSAALAAEINEAKDRILRRHR
jgi:DnaJ-domain-containing protein 1